jgi:predicted PurR-regulated permease PerM
MNAFPEFKKQIISISTWSILKIILILLALVFLWILRDIVGIIFVSLLLAALIEPFASFCSKYKIPRSLSVLFIYLIILTILAFSIVLLIPPLLDQTQELVRKFSVLYGVIGGYVAKFQTFSLEHGFGQNVTTSLQGFQEQFATTLYGLFSTISGFFGGIVSLIIVLVLTFYLVVEEDGAKRFFTYLAPIEYQPFFTSLFGKMQKKIGLWLRGQLLLAFLVGILVYIGLRILGIPYALLLALLSGLFEIVPYAGPIFATIPALIIGFSVSPFSGFLVLILYLVIQQLENNLLVPKVMQHVTGIHPVISIVALLVGIQLGGVVGAILAIPVATMLGVIIQELFTQWKHE